MIVCIVSDNNSIRMHIIWYSDASICDCIRKTFR
nr:MAG TPA: hypothetical protein [Caudoviricetes sp.]